MENTKNLTQDDLMNVEGGLSGWFDEKPWITSGIIYRPVELSSISELSLPILL